MLGAPCWSRFGKSPDRTCCLEGCKLSRLPDSIHSEIVLRARRIQCRPPCDTTSWCTRLLYEDRDSLDQKGFPHAAPSEKSLRRFVYPIAQRSRTLGIPFQQVRNNRRG